MLKFSGLLFSGLVISLSLRAQMNMNDSTNLTKSSDTLGSTEITIVPNVNSTTTLFSNPNTLSASGFYQNNSNNNPYLPGNHHGLLLNMASYWDDNFDAQLYVDYSTPSGITNPHIWYRFSNADGYTSWYLVWANNNDGAGSGMDADLIRGHVPQWTTNGSTIYATNSGNVLIGKTSQTNTSYKLDVNGNIRADKVVVNTSGADYVFDSTYSLTPLDSLSNYIKKHKHLPGIPSAEQMQKEGLSVGDAYTRLLEKMEEMTRYIIELNKQNYKLKNEIMKIKNDNEN